MGYLNQPITNAINNLNNRQRARSVSTFDFSTLYTKIPHDKLLFVLNSLVDFCFKGGVSKYIAIKKSKACWVVHPFKDCMVFGKLSIKAGVKYLMENCYFNLGNKIFRQIIGITMGSDPAPFFAKWFLYYYESKWLKNVQRSDLRRARKFPNTFRFIDDLVAISDGGEFEKSFHEIYPAEMELGKENDGTNSTSFLDLEISITDNKFKLSLYDKRDGFPFSIVRMPYRSSNMPSMIFYSAIGVEILRIAKATSIVDTFLVSVRSLVIRLIKQGAKIAKTAKVLQISE